MTSITWASLRYVQELGTILDPQNRTQGSSGQQWCDSLFSQLFSVPGPAWLLVVVVESREIKGASNEA